MRLGLAALNCQLLLQLLHLMVERGGHCDPGLAGERDDTIPFGVPSCPQQWDKPPAWPVERVSKMGAAERKGRKGEDTVPRKETCLFVCKEQTGVGVGLAPGLGWSGSGTGSGPSQGG